MTAEINRLFAALRSALDHAAKHEGSEPHAVAAMNAALAIGEIMVTDAHRMADALDKLVGNPRPTPPK